MCGRHKCHKFLQARCFSCHQAPGSIKTNLKALIPAKENHPLVSSFLDPPTIPDRNTHVYYTRLTALCQGLPRWAGTRKVKPIWILLKQMTVSGSGIHWAVCKSAPFSRQTATPAHHHSVFLQAGCPSCHPTNSVKALKADRKEHKISFTSAIVVLLLFDKDFYKLLCNV